MRIRHQENDEALEAIAKILRADEDLEPLGEYCALRPRGLRAQALRAVQRFVEGAAHWPSSRRERVAERFLKLWWDHPEARQLMPHPLRAGFLLPTVEAWCARSPDDAVAVRWLGLLTDEVPTLRRALALQPGDVAITGALVRYLLRFVDFATHEVGSSGFIGDVAESESALVEAQELLDQAREPSALSGYQCWQQELDALVQDWKLYSEHPVGGFLEWCHARGRGHGGFLYPSR